MTETSCIISIMDEDDNLSGHVGSPNAACGELLNHQKEIYGKKIMKYLMCLLVESILNWLSNPCYILSFFLLWFFSFQK